MVVKKEILIIAIIFIIVFFLPSFVCATDYVVCLDAGHSNNVDFSSDKKWFEEMNPGLTWNDSKYGTTPDYDNPISGIITSSEATLTKETVVYMIEYLKQYDNIKVVVCPRTSIYSQRPYFAKENNADVHLSMHYNAGGGTGVETHSKPGDSESKQFSQIIVNAVTEATGLYNRGAKETSYGIIKNSSEIGCPSIVLEGGFMDNQNDLLFLSESANLKKVAAGAVSGILSYLNIEDKGYPDIPDYDGYSGQNSSTSTAGSLGTVTSNEDKFLGLWKNATGVYEQYYNEDGSINDLSLYDKKGQIVRYSSTTASVADDIIGASSWFFSLLEMSERTQNHLTIMKYLMNVYTDTNEYGDLTFEKDIASIFSSSSGFSSVSGIYGGTIQEKVWFALKDAGFSEEATAGVMGNISQESSWNKDSVNSSSGAKGICQWLGGRANGLDSYASSKGKEWTDEDIQIEYLIGELTPGGGADGYATYNVLDVNGCSVEDWKNASSPEDAAVAFRKTFERCGEAEANDARRKSEARKFYDEFKGKTRSSGGTFTESSDDSKVKGYYTSSKGKKFTILNQNNISGWGSKCNRAACAIIASGYSNESADELINYMNSTYNGDLFDAIPSNYWNKYNLKISSYSGNKTSDYMSNLKAQLNSGGYAMFWLNNGGKYTGKSGTNWTSKYHWIAIIDYRSENGVDKICVADYRGITWVDIDEFSQNGVTNIVYINEK